MSRFIDLLSTVNNVRTIRMMEENKEHTDNVENNLLDDAIKEEYANQYLKEIDEIKHNNFMWELKDHIKYTFIDGETRIKVVGLSEQDFATLKNLYPEYMDELEEYCSENGAKFNQVIQDSDQDKSDDLGG